MAPFIPPPYLPPPCLNCPATAVAEVGAGIGLHGSILLAHHLLVSALVLPFVFPFHSASFRANRSCNALYLADWVSLSAFCRFLGHVSLVSVVLRNLPLNFFFAVFLMLCRDDLGIIKRVGELAAENGVSIHAILQNPIEDVDNVDFVVTTDPCKCVVWLQLLCC